MPERRVTNMLRDVSNRDREGGQSMKVTRLERVMGSLLGEGKLTPALDTLRGTPQLAGPDLDEFAAAVESLAERIKDRKNTPLRYGGVGRPWL